MSMADFNTQVINEFRENDGQVGGMFEGMPMILVHHVGAKSGEPRVAAGVPPEDGDRYVIFASKAGAPENPAWYHNLKAHPETKIEVGDDDARRSSPRRPRARSATVCSPRRSPRCRSSPSTRRRRRARSR